MLFLPYPPGFKYLARRVQSPTPMSTVKLKFVYSALLGFLPCKVRLFPPRGIRTRICCYPGCFRGYFPLERVCVLQATNTIFFVHHFRKHFAQATAINNNSDCDMLARISSNTPIGPVRNTLVVENLRIRYETHSSPVNKRYPTSTEYPMHMKTRKIMFEMQVARVQAAGSKENKQGVVQY